MLSQIISYTGNGTAQSLQCKFVPECVFVVPFGSQVPVMYQDGSWCNRAIPFQGWSIDDTIRIFGRTVAIGSAAGVNTSGNKYAMVAFAAENGDMGIASWCGNGGTLKVPMKSQATPTATIIKRDATWPLIIKNAGVPAFGVDGVAVTDCVSFAPGAMNLTSDPTVNEWIPASGMGEGISGPVFFGDAVKTGTYTGTGSARLVPLGCDAAMLFVWRVGSTAVARVIVRGIPLVKTADTNAATADAKLDQGFLSLGTSLNTSGATYAYLAIPYREPDVVAPSTINRAIGAGRKAWKTAGRGNLGYVDFGTGLNVSGEKTITWFGAVMGDPASGVDFDEVMLMRASGAHGTTPGTSSWGLIAVARTDPSGLKWMGPHVFGLVNGNLNYVPPLDTAVWRTGVMMPMGVHAHTLVIRADKTMEYWRDGVLVKLRQVLTDTFDSYAGHRVTMGARWTGSAYSNNSRLGFIEASFCNAAQSYDQIRAEHARLISGSSDTPSLTGLMARWRAEDIAGLTLPDLVGSNNGTITGGVVISL